MMNTDQDFTLSSLFVNKATNVLCVVIHFNSRCTTAWAVTLNFAFTLRIKFYWRMDLISACNTVEC